MADLPLAYFYGGLILAALVATVISGILAERDRRAKERALHQLALKNRWLTARRRAH